MLRQNPGKIATQPIMDDCDKIPRLNNLYPDALPDTEKAALEKEEAELTDRLADPKIAKHEKYAIWRQLNTNLLKQRDDFLHHLKPANNPEIRKHYTYQEGEPVLDYAARLTDHPMFEKILVPTAIIALPAFFRFYPVYACWRNVTIHSYTRGEIRRKRFIWRRNVLAEGVPPAITERIAGRVLLFNGFALFFNRMLEQYLYFATSPKPYMQQDFE